MSARQPFASWGMYDNVAVCFDCKHQHLIPKGEQMSPQAWLDWQAKHQDHHVAIFPERQMGPLGDRVAGFKHNADVKAAYASSADYTCTLTGLASDTNLLAGRETSSVSNASNKYLDEMVSGKITAGTSPTATRIIEVHGIFAMDDAPAWPDVFDGTDSAETITSADIKAAICAPLAIIGTSNNSDRTYPFRLVGLRQFCADALPVAHVLFVTHSTAVNLNATASNQKLTHTPVYATVT